MSVEDSKKIVAGHIEAFKKTKELAELRSAADQIDRIEVHTAPSHEERQAARAAKPALWLTLLDTFDSAKDPTFDPADVPAGRVTIPAGTPLKPGFLIPSPEGIANPADRQKFDQAVKTNDDKARRYRFQKELRQLDSELTARAERYLASANLGTAQSAKEMNEAITARIHDSDRADRLRSLVAPPK